MDLITIGIITYNSAKYIRETLDSCLTQGWSNLELIVADDASSDDTAAIVKDWMAEHGEKFTSCHFHQHSQNLGITANINWVLSNAKGRYIKPLGGDDLLKKNSIRELYEFSQKEPQAKFIYTDIDVFHFDDLHNAKFLNTFVAGFSDADCNKQYAVLLKGNKVYGASTFYERETMLKCGGYVGARNIEDHMTFINLTMKGIRLFHYPVSLVYYRKHDSNMASKSRRWLEAEAEMKRYRNEHLLKKNLCWKLRFFCKQDCLKAKRKVEKLTLGEKLSYIFMRRAYKALLLLKVVDKY